MIPELGVAYIWFDYGEVWWNIDHLEGEHFSFRSQRKDGAVEEKKGLTSKQSLPMLGHWNVARSVFVTLSSSWNNVSNTKTPPQKCWLSVLLGSYWVLLGFTWFKAPKKCWLSVLLGSYWVLLGFTGFHWVLLSFTGFCCVLMGFTRFYLMYSPKKCWLSVLLGSHWVLLGFTGFYWVLLGFTGFYWVLLGFTGFARLKGCLRDVTS